MDGPKNNNYWNDLETIVKSELKKYERKRDEDTAMIDNIKDEVMRIMKAYFDRLYASIQFTFFRINPLKNFISSKAKCRTK
jgi:hypothetical protein